MRNMLASNKANIVSLFLLMSLIIFAAFGCAKKVEPAPAPAPGRHEDVFYSIKAPPMTDFQDLKQIEKTLYYATNRAVIIDRETVTEFQTTRSKFLKYGKFDVKIEKVDIPKITKKIRELSYLTGILKTDQDDRINVKIEISKKLAINGLDNLINALNKPGDNKQDGSTVLVFIHGYNNSFDSAAKDAAVISYVTSFPGQTLLFSWPSKDSKYAYFEDRNTAYWSVKHVEEFLTNIARSNKIDSIHIVAHSMGNEIFVRALSNISMKFGQKNNVLLSKFKSISLAAPDIDRETFCEQFSNSLDRLSARLTLYTSKHDRALYGSELVQGGFQYDRLGQKPTLCSNSKNFSVVDASNAGTDYIGHGAVHSSYAIAYDLGCVFRNMPRNDSPYISMCQSDASGLCWEALPKKVDRK